MAEGDLYIARPGRMRLDYAPPAPIEIVANGTWLIYHDKKLKQVSHLWLKSTPAGILLKENLSFNDRELTVTGVERGPGTLRISVVRTSDPLEGNLTLVFSEGPLTLRKWSVTDAQGVTTTVTLQNARPGVALKDELFEFDNPYPNQGQSN